MDSVYAPRFFIAGVPPFGYPRILAYLQLPAAFRSLSRPSSAPNAKASSVCSSSLELPRIVFCPILSRFSFFARIAVFHTCSFFGKIVFFYPVRKNLILRRISSPLLMFPLLCLSCMSHKFFLLQKNLYDDSYSVFNEHSTLLRVS